MTAQQAANTLLNANYRPDQILRALEDIKKNAAPTASLKVSR